MKTSCYASIYDNFQHWFEGGSVYVYSDPHFSNEEMKYIRHNYIDDDEQISRINKVVHKNDTIIFLGDIGNENLIKKIKGRKILIMGNHDKGKTNYKDLFQEVYSGPLLISPKILLSHEPLALPSCFFNIHGHDHSGLEYKNDGYHLNVCAEWIDYQPVSLTKMLKDGAFKHIEDIHRQTIDRASARK